MDFVLKRKGSFVGQDTHTYLVKALGNFHPSNFIFLHCHHELCIRIHGMDKDNIIAHDNLSWPSEVLTMDFFITFSHGECRSACVRRHLRELTLSPSTVQVPGIELMSGLAAGIFIH